MTAAHPNRHTIRLVTALVLGLAVSALPAKERLYRRFDHRNGLTSSHVTAIAQDDEGFLWIGMFDELQRYDGDEFRRWNTDMREFNQLQWDPGLGMLARTMPDGAIWRVTQTGLERLVTDDGQVVGPSRWMSVGTDATLWLTGEDGTLLRRGGDGAWSRYEPTVFDGEKPRLVFGSRTGGAYVDTAASLWRLGPDGTVERVLEAAGTKMVAEHPNGALYVTVRGRTQLREDSRLVEIVDGVARTIFTFRSRPVDIVVRGDDLWFTGQETYRYRPGGAVEQIDPRSDSSISFPELLVDREGSLWLGGYDGLVQFPEPDTVAFTAPDGLPDIPANGDLARTDEGIWVGFYDGLGLIRPDTTGDWVASTARRGQFAYDLCVDGQQRLWTFQAPTPSDDTGVSGPGILERTHGRFRFHPIGDDLFSAGPCSRGADGRVWFLIGDIVYRTPRGVGNPEPVGPGPGEWETVFMEHDGRLWSGAFNRLCSIGVDAILGGRTDWVCEDVPQMGWTYDLASTPSGTTWAAASRGLFRRAGDTWEPIPGAPQRFYHEIIESPAGGFWVTSTGAATRAIERPDLPDGLEIVEQLSMWQGITSARNGNLLDEPDGTLWVTAPKGPIRVPARARFARLQVPSVTLVEASVDGEGVPITDEIELPFSRNRLELRFAALTFRDPLRVRYRVRSDPKDHWAETRTPGFRFTDLAPGRYRPEVIASLDGEHWTAVPASVSFAVLPPWYRTGWALALFGLAGAAGLYSVYRARVAVLLRLERQRTRIAMDLHDEMGAGLGSIGILATLVSRNDLDVVRRDGIAVKIAETAEELGAKLRDILWSLRTPAADLQGLAAHLAEYGGRLFPDDPDRFGTEFPDRWPATPLSLAVRRNLQSIALEAMHNAARHSAASKVRLGFDTSGRTWSMWIEDDGHGMPAGTQATRPERGIGLEAMRDRASQIDATIAWMPRDGGGTRVQVGFRPNAEDRRLRGGRP